MEAVYSFAFDKNIKINKLKEMFWRDDLGANEKLLFHGAKTEIDGEIDIHASLRLFTFKSDKILSLSLSA